MIEDALSGEIDSLLYNWSCISPSFSNLHYHEWVFIGTFVFLIL